MEDMNLDPTEELKSSLSFLEVWMLLHHTFPETQMPRLAELAETKRLCFLLRDEDDVIFCSGVTLRLQN